MLCYFHYQYNPVKLTSQHLNQSCCLLFTRLFYGSRQTHCTAQSYGVLRLDVGEPLRVYANVSAEAALQLKV